MRKTNFFLKKTKNIISLINNLLEKNLNKLKLDNLTKLAKRDKIILTFVAVLTLFISYLLIPTFFKQIEISKRLNSGLLDKLNLNFKFEKKLNYNIFPRPHFISEGTIILDKQNSISEIKNFKIFISMKNLFSLKDLEIDSVIIENANFNLNKENYNFFTNLLKNDYKNINFKIKNSNIFF